ncbi:Gfo/Idh/MocA family protein [Pseudaestuariivita atlantica]|uniref:Oxidoreductase n=1 Tax=Pseudaestuariivita atlantica TaxID=1317121 RepID=A0A0L1JUF8_9RHOB|nr:Gfo/Idh/MocA family oxidoreductase [Pseudaestuariivita atlantica]KNG95327.1 oxidoreductase [Pseudaestuariivita atlantica]
MTDKPVRWGILGAAKFAREHMGPAIHAAKGADLAALATSSPDKAAPFRAFAPGIDVHDGYDALLADASIDAVYIPLPNHLHVDWTLKALDAGKHVLCEKPLAMRADQFDAVIAKRDATGLVAAEAYMIVHHPQWHLARTLVRSGEIGELVQVDGVFSYDNRTDTGNIRNRADTGGGGIPDIGVYTYGSARFVTGEEPEEITHAEITWENGVDVWARVCARFPSFQYHAVTSMRMAARQEMTFHGSKGFVRLTAPFNPQVFGQAEVHLHRPGFEVVTTRFPAVNHYVQQVEAFGRSVREGAEYPCPLEFSRGTQAMIDMVFARARG